MKIVILAIMIVMLATSVFAAEIALVSPTDGAMFTQSRNEFTFITTSTDILRCSLLIDGVAVKNISYTESINNRNINFAATTENGEHVWQVQCESAKEILQSKTRKFTTTISDEGAEVRVQASGVFRGSLVHTFEFTNTPAQKPVVVPKLAAGDFIDIVLKLPPSKLTAEYAVKQASSKNNKKFIRLQDQKTGVEYTLNEGENATLNVSTSRVIASFTGMEQNKASITFYSAVGGASDSIVPITEPSNNITNETVTEIPTAESQETEVPIKEPPKETPEPPKMSVFKRFISWLSNLFG